MGSAITYARRYCAQALVGVCGGEDDDAEMATHSENGVTSVSIGGPKQKPEDIFEEFMESVTEENYIQELESQWDSLMKRTNTLSHRKMLASLLNSKKNSLMSQNNGDDL